MLNEKPLVSIITVSFNSEKTINDTIESILSQTYENIEYIVVDGLSKDSTVSMVKNYEDKFLERGYKFNIISEKDEGLYDAMNKGINMAQGRIIGILNSDDFYIDEYVIEKIVKKMLLEKADCLYANLLFVDENNLEKVVRKWKSGKGRFILGWNPPHPSTFITNQTYKKVGLYKKNYQISSDYDILYKVFKSGSKIAYLDEYIVKMRTGGKSTSGIKSNIVASKEIYQTLKENKQSLKMLTVILRLLRKLKQFV